MLSSSSIGNGFAGPSVAPRVRCSWTDSASTRWMRSGRQKASLPWRAFLRQSEHLVVLWSPRYFSRLWCVYEVATWLHLGKGTAEVFPVAMASALLMLQAAVFGSLAFMVSLAPIHNVAEWGGLNALSLLMFLPPLHVTRLLARDLEQLPAQIRRFSVREADCFCCQNAHVHPGNGMPMPCDRVLVFRTIAGWFSALPGEQLLVAGVPEVSPLDRFDEQVHRHFAHDLLDPTASSRRTFWHACLVSAPVWWYYCDRFVLLSHMDAQDALRLGFVYLWEASGCGPCMVKLCIRMSTCFQRWLGIRERTSANGFITLLQTLATLPPVYLLWLPVEVAVSFADPMPQVAATLLSTVAAVALWIGPRSAVAMSRLWQRVNPKRV